MDNFIIEIFYLFFEGIMLFQVVFFGMIYIVSKRKDVLYYSLLNLISGIYFFLNAPDTFLNIDENIVFNSSAYPYMNFALFMSMIFMYLVFLKEIFIDTLKQYVYVKKIYTITFYTIPLLYILYVLFTFSGWNSNIIFYTGHVINGPFCTLLFILNFRQKGYKRLLIYGMLIIFICVIITVALTIRYNSGSTATIFDKYPLSIIKMGMLIDILLFQLALLKRWNEQEKQLAVEKLQSQLEVEKFRNKISGELHDDIGSTLSGIVMYSHMTDGQLKTGEYDKAKNSVSIIQKSANEIVEKLSDLVWTINPGKDSFAAMLEKIAQYGEEICRAKNIYFESVYNNADLIKEPGMDVRRHFYLFAKEAINNAVKHSDATAIKFKISYIKDILKIVITDNGKGYDADSIKRGNGLNNMQHRADQLGGDFSVQAKQVGGCLISLKIKIP